MDNVCKNFNCKKQSLSRWVERYEKNNVKRNSRKSKSYKVKNKHVDYSLELLKKEKHYQKKLKINMMILI